MFDDDDFINFIGRLPEQQRDYISDMFEAMASSADEVEPTDLLFVGSDGERVVKCFHYPIKVLGKNGPVIICPTCPVSNVSPKQTKILSSQRFQMNLSKHVQMIFKTSSPTWTWQTTHGTNSCRNAQ